MVEAGVGGGAVGAERRGPSACSPPRTEPGWTCDGLSFAQVYERHGDAVFAVAGRIGIAHLAPDVTQDVFMRLWRSPGRYDASRGSLRTFLVMAARNLAIDRARSESARLLREEQATKARPTTAAPFDDVVARLAVGATGEISEALSRLRTDTREAIVAAFFGGLTYSEVAESLDAPEGTIKSRIRRGLTQLRSELDGPEGPAAPGADPVASPRQRRGGSAAARPTGGAAPRPEPPPEEHHVR